MTTPFELKRFLDAQDAVDTSDSNLTAYQKALKEITDGGKKGHWIWYIFPQGPFGTSTIAQKYAITSPSEATAYLQHSILRDRLLEITNAVANQLITDVRPETLMGCEGDCQKLASSMTLSNFIADKLDDQDLKDATKNVLSGLATHSWTQCTKTPDWLQNF